MKQLFTTKILGGITLVLIPASVFASSMHQVDVCHVPADDPANAVTVNIDISALNGHEEHALDYIGKCGSNISPSSENLYAVFNCTNSTNLLSGDYRTQLLASVNAYYQPVVIGSPVVNPPTSSTEYSAKNVTWTATTEAVLSTLSDCRDSLKGNAQLNQTTDGQQWIVQNCKNLSGDVADTYRTALQNAANSTNTSTYIIVPELALNSGTVKSEYDTCIAGVGNQIYSYQGDDGHNFKVLESCSNSAALNTAISDYQTSVENNPAKPIFLTASSMDDYQIQTSYAACCDSNKGGATCKTNTAGSGYSGRINWRQPDGY